MSAIAFIVNPVKPKVFFISTGALSAMRSLLDPHGLGCDIWNRKAALGRVYNA